VKCREVVSRHNDYLFDRSNGRRDSLRSMKLPRARNAPRIWSGYPHHVLQEIMKSCTPRKCLCGRSVTVTVSVISCGLADAQDMAAQSTVNTSPPIAGGDSIMQEGSYSPAAEDALPDAPVSQDQSSEQEQQTSPRIPKAINRIAILPPRLNAGSALTDHDKWEIYYHRTYSPAAVIFPLFGSGIQMANPKKDYPADWKDGMGAFGRIYGNAMAQRTARGTADFGTQLLLHEDPRYQRSDSTNPLLRVGHALVWTFVDKSDSGHRTLAMSTFTVRRLEALSEWLTCPMATTTSPTLSSAC
jgi:hypothetical protein